MWSHQRHNSWFLTHTYIIHIKMFKLVLSRVGSIHPEWWKHSTKPTQTFFFHFFFTCALTTNTIVTLQMSKESLKGERRVGGPFPLPFRSLFLARVFG